MSLRLIKIAILWVLSGGIIAYVLNRNQEDDISRNINQKLVNIINDHLMNLGLFSDQSMYDDLTYSQDFFTYNYPIYVYRDGQLIFWNSNAYFPAYEKIKSNDNVRFITDDNISVISLRVSKQEDSGALVEVYSIIPIATNLLSGNHQSINLFNEQLFSDVEVDFSINGFAVSYDGVLLFKLSAVPKSTVTSLLDFVILFVLTFTLFYTINLILTFIAAKRSKSYLWVLALLLSVWLTYLFLMKTGGINSLVFFGFQLIPNLASLSLEQIFVYFLFLFFILLRLTEALFKSKKVIKLSLIKFRTLTAIFSFLGGVIIPHLLFSAIELIAHNTLVNLDITESVRFSNHRILYYLFLMLLSSCYFFLNHALYKFFIKTYNFSKHIGFILIILLGYFLSPFGSQWYVLIFQLIIWGVMYMTACSFQLNKFKYITLFYLVLISVFVSILNAKVILESHAQSELIEKQDYAVKIQTGRDSLGEYFISKLVEKMENDSIISLRFKNELFFSNLIVDRIRELKASYLNNYDIIIYLLDSSRNIYGFTKAKELFFSKDLLLKAKNTNYKNIYSVPMIENGLHKYYSVIPINSEYQRGEIIVEYTKKRYSTQTVFSSLFNIENKNFQKSKTFDYAIYQNGILKHQLGNYKFPLKIDEYCPNVTNQSICIHDDQSIYFTQIQDGRMLMIVSDAYSNYRNFVNITFTFILSLFFFGFVFFIMTRLKPIESFSLTNKIQLYVGLSFFVSTAIVGALILSQLTSSYRAEINRSYQKKAVNIAQNFKQDLKLFLDNNTDKYQLTEKLAKIANLSRGDILLYDAKGKILGSSNQEIFDQNILSKNIHPMAFEHIISNRGQTKIIEEDLISTKFKTVYVAVYGNEINQLMGILAFPFFDSKNHVNAQQIEVFNDFILFFTSIFILTIVVGYYGMKGIINPIKIIADRMRKTQFMSEETTPLLYKEKDEIGMLVFEYNQMLSKLELSKDKLAKIQKETAWRELAQQVAHEIKNPLTPMKLKIQQMLRSMNDTSVNYEVLNSLLGQIDNLSSIADSFSSFAQMPVPHNEVFNLSKLLRETLSLYASDELQIHHTIAEDVMIYADIDLMRQILNNLIINAIQSYFESPYYLEVCLQINEDKFLLAIKDKGQGISELDIFNIFKPYFTTKENGKGIGLAFAKKGVEQAGGNIWFETEKEVGTSFFIKMPMASNKNTS